MKASRTASNPGLTKPDIAMFLVISVHAMAIFSYLLLESCLLI
jgi:hypothetical protein